MRSANSPKSKYCPYCMSRLTDGEVCPVCGLTRGNYQPQPHHLPPGTVLVERYMVGRVLGEGGFGITYIGRDMRLDYRVAIKEYLPSDQVSRNTEIALDVTRYATVSEEAYEKGLQRFLNEARTLALMFKQPQIVTVHDFFEANGTAYIVMEYVDGTTFAELVKQYGGRIAPEELFPMIEPLFGALANVHKQGILHRDISPDNLMLENGNVRLLDFGSAREVQPTGQQTMTIALKKGYGPIEQYQGKGQGPWTDVYALSATIYYCLTGVKPPDAVERILDDELVPPRELGVDMPQWQEQALLYGMSVNPTKRYRTMDAMHAGLYLPPADTIVPSPTVLGGVAVLEAGFAPEEAQAQALSQAEERQTEAEAEAEALLQPEEQLETEADALSQMEDQKEQVEVDQTQAEANQLQAGVNLSQDLLEEEKQSVQTLTQDEASQVMERNASSQTEDVFSETEGEISYHEDESIVSASNENASSQGASMPMDDATDDGENINTIMQDEFVTGIQHISSEDVGRKEDAVITDTGNKDIKENPVETDTQEENKGDVGQPVATGIKADDNQTTMSGHEDTAEESVAERQHGRLVSYISTHWPIYIAEVVVLAAVVAFVVCVVVLFWEIGQELDTNDQTQLSDVNWQDDDLQDENDQDAKGQTTAEDEQDDVVEQESETEEPVDYDALFTSDATVYYDSDTYRDTNFQISMTLDSVPAIVLSGSIEMDRENMVIDKPVLIEEDIWANVFSHVTVTGNGILYIKGSVTVNGMMDVTDGGQIVVADGGELDVDGLLWLQNEDSCVIQDGGALVLEGETYTSFADAALERSLLVLDEDELTAYATYVTTTAEFQQAESSNASAIIIDADMTFTGDVNQGVPVIISEGVTVTMEGTWFNRENVFINHGTFNGSFQGGDWVDDEYGDVYGDNSLWKLLNFGECHLENVNIPSRGIVVNGGRLVIDPDVQEEPVICNGTFCNYGKYEGGLDNDLRFCNYGVCNITFGGNWKYKCSMLNLGEVHITGGTNAGYVENRGSITVEAGVLTNNGMMESETANSAITVAAEGDWDAGYGVVMYHSASTLDLQKDGEELDASQSFHFSDYDDNNIYVYTADDLADALDGDWCQTVVMVVDITWEGNLDIANHVLVIEDQARLTVDGDVTVSGGDAALYLQQASLDIGNHTLTLSDSAVLLIKEGGNDALQCGTLDVQQGCRVMAAAHWSAEGMHLTADGNGSVINTAYGASLQDCVVDIGEGAVWRNDEDLALSTTMLNVEGYVTQNSMWGQTSLDADTVVTVAENGFMGISDCFRGTVALDGTIENHGTFRINYSDFNVDASGILNNYHSFAGNSLHLQMAGTLRNEGEVVFGDDSEFTDAGGSYTGDEPVQTNEDAYDFYGGFVF